MRNILADADHAEALADTEYTRGVKPHSALKDRSNTLNCMRCSTGNQCMDLETLLRRLLPTAPVQAPPPGSVPTEMEIILERLHLNAPASAPTPPPRAAITDI